MAEVFKKDCCSSVSIFGLSTLIWASNPGSGYSVYSTETYYPDNFPVWMQFDCLPLVCHGRLVMAKYMHPSNLGGFTLAILLGIIPNRVKILILLKAKCPSL